MANMRPPHFRSIPSRLGISEETFDAHLTSKIDSILMASAENRRRARERDCASTSVPIPALHVLTKEDNLEFFRNRDFPTTSALFGVYQWARTLVGPGSTSISNEMI